MHQACPDGYFTVIRAQYNRPSRLGSASARQLSLTSERRLNIHPFHSDSEPFQLGPPSPPLALVSARFVPILAEVVRNEVSPTIHVFQISVYHFLLPKFCTLHFSIDTAILPFPLVQQVECRGSKVAQREPRQRTLPAVWPFSSSW